MADQIEPYPSASTRDHLRTVLDAGIATVPVVGGSLQVLIDAVIAPSLERRRDAWFRKVEQMLNELSDRQAFSVDALLGNDEFVSSLIHATRIAAGTHLEAKLDMLKNALKHLAVSEGAGEFMDRHMFGLVEALSPEHVVVLRYMSDPIGWYETHDIPRDTLTMGTPRQVMDEAELPVVGIVHATVLSDLQQRGLADTGRLDIPAAGDGLWQSLLTDLGHTFLTFVTDV